MTITHEALEAALLLELEQVTGRPMAEWTADELRAALHAATVTSTKIAAKWMATLGGAPGSRASSRGRPRSVPISDDELLQHVETARHLLDMRTLREACGLLARDHLRRAGRHTAGSILARTTEQLQKRVSAARRRERIRK